jgi:hypothetical protein
LDQFEQWLHVNNSCLSGQLAVALRQCDGNRLQCLIVVRSDFWLGITRFLRELEVPLIEGRNSAHLDLFDIRHSRRVMAAFGRSYGCLPPTDETMQSEHHEFLDQATAQIATDGWVVPVRLTLFVEMMKRQKWELETLTRLGGEQGLRVAYLDQVFNSPMAAPRHRLFRPQAEAVLRALLPDTGIELKGRCRTRFELKQASGLLDKEAQFCELLDILDSQLRLITPTEDVESQNTAVADHGSSTRWSTIQPSFQLTHDYLVPALRDWLTREDQSTRAGRARLCLEERDRQWQQAQDARYLPSLIETIRICAFTNRASWTLSQTSMIRKAAWRNLRLLVIWVITAATLSTLFLAFYFVTRPPDPLVAFQNSNLPAATREAAFDRLDLSDVAALGPVLYTMKHEQDPDVLRHSIEGIHDFLRQRQTVGGGGGDSVRDLIQSEIGELLGRAEIVGGSEEDSIRAKLFSTYALLAPTPDVLEFAADAFERNRTLGKRALADYLATLDTKRWLQQPTGPGHANDVPDDSIRIVTNLVRLMDALPLGEERSRASESLARLPVDSLASLFLAAFAGKPHQYAERSAQIYVTSWEALERRRSVAEKLLDEMGRRLAQLVNPMDSSEIPSEQLVYVLASIQHLQQEAAVQDQQLLENVRTLLARRNEHRDSDVIDVACAAYAALNADETQRRDIADLAPLREIVAGRNEDIAYRCAAAKALASIDHATIVNDLAAIATATDEPVQLRRDAIKSLGSIGRHRLSRTIESAEITEVLASLFNTEAYQSDELLPEVVAEVATIGGLEQLGRILSTLSRREHNLNLHVHDAVFAMLLRNPHQAEQIAEQTMSEIVNLSDDAKTALFPSPEQFLADALKMRYSKIETAEFVAACRQLAKGLAHISSRHTAGSVRRLAHENLARLLPLKELPDIDPDGDELARQKQLQQWNDKWSNLADRLYITEDLQFEVR